MNDWQQPVPSDQRALYSTVGEEASHEPIPGMEVCDFCSSATIAWSYPCGRIRIASLGFASDDPWAACETCHALIEANDRAGLAERCVEGFVRTAPAEGWVPTPGELTAVAHQFTTIHAAFFDARTGAASAVHG